MTKIPSFSRKNAVAKNFPHYFSSGNYISRPWTSYPGKYQQEKYSMLDFGAVTTCHRIIKSHFYWKSRLWGTWECREVSGKSPRRHVTAPAVRRVHYWIAASTLGSLAASLELCHWKFTVSPKIQACHRKFIKSDMLLFTRKFRHHELPLRAVVSRERGLLAIRFWCHRTFALCHRNYQIIVENRITHSCLTGAGSGSWNYICIDALWTSL